MPDFLVLNHSSRRKQTDEDWAKFLTVLIDGKHLIGGSAVAVRRGQGQKNGRRVPLKSTGLRGYLIITAPSFAAAKRLCRLNPVHLAGGLIEIIPLIKTD